MDLSKLLDIIPTQSLDKSVIFFPCLCHFSYHFLFGNGSLFTDSTAEYFSLNGKARFSRYIQLPVEVSQ